MRRASIGTALFRLVIPTLKILSVMPFAALTINEQGLLEIMGLVDEEELGDTVEGYLTAVEVFQRIFRHYRYGEYGML